ncbi:hypothetical protein BKA66DRAFT_585369 [Pyrenochaeta sp. MPI-SDFR-AT-0127]|nr:hypothetical protein BKA66DRAFT_585369 [Pyrenochaeta sp. MPI-SDFR-AT-0127]
MEANRRAYETLGQALYDCHCHWEAAEFWEGVSKKTCGPAEGIRQLLKQKKDAALPLGGTLQEQKDRLRDGGVVTVQYPWMQQCHLTRSQEVVNLVNDELRENEEPTACYLGRSTLTSRDDMLEIHAARPIQKGECILIDRTTTGICSNVGNECCDNCYGHVTSSPTRATCCSAVYCSAACHDLALNTYHKALCGQDFRWLSAPAKGLTHNASPLRPLLMLRILASCVQTSVETSPLDHPLIARLQPLADCSHLDVFTFAESITTPIRILQQLNVDIFANRNFYTMVLHTIWTRIANNKAGAADRERGFVDAISPLLVPFQSQLRAEC